jgi:hypothetical protein
VEVRHDVPGLMTAVCEMGDGTSKIEISVSIVTHRHELATILVSELSSNRIRKEIYSRGGLYEKRTQDVSMLRNSIANWHVVWRPQ